MKANGTCRSCHAPIVWCKTEAGNNTPMDPEPKLEGKFMIVDNVAVYLGNCGAGEYVRTGDKMHDDGLRYVSHFVTCPNASRHRKAKT